MSSLSSIDKKNIQMTHSIHSKWKSQIL